MLELTHEQAVTHITKKNYAVLYDSVPPKEVVSE
jgi:hypothetical protein